MIDDTRDGLVQRHRKRNTEDSNLDRLVKQVLRALANAHGEAKGVAKHVEAQNQNVQLPQRLVDVVVLDFALQTVRGHEPVLSLEVAQPEKNRENKRTIKLNLLKYY